MKYTASLVKLHIDERIQARREDALRRGIPVADDETLNFLVVLLQAIQPKRILEVGTAVGLSGAAMLSVCPNARLTTMELEEERYLEAKQNFAYFGFTDRVTAYLGDAGEILAMMDGEYDFVFLDGPKAHYIYMLNDCIRLLKKGGMLISDNILYKGMIADDEHVIRRKITIVKRLRRFISAQMQRDELETVILPLGDGVTVAVKK